APGCRSTMLWRHRQPSAKYPEAERIARPGKPRLLEVDRERAAQPAVDVRTFLEEWNILQRCGREIRYARAHLEMTRTAEEVARCPSPFGVHELRSVHSEADP